jgi:hypothetical protein
LYGCTGGPDLAALPGIGRLIRVVPVNQVDQLREALVAALDDASGDTVPGITEAERQMLSWRGYALRHLQVISSTLAPLSVGAQVSSLTHEVNRARD